MASSPDTRRNLDIDSDLKCSQKRMRNIGDGKLFEIKLCCFFQIFKGFLDGLTLTNCSHFWTFCNIDILFFANNSGKNADLHGCLPASSGSFKSPPAG
jgi:hypothetical protein